MNEAIQSWLQQAATTRGVAGGGVFRTDRTCVVKSFRDDLSESQLEQTLRKLMAAVEALQTHQIPSERFRWTFEGGEIHCLLFGAGAMAALLANQGLARLPDIDHLFTSFPVAEI